MKRISPFLLSLVAGSLWLGSHASAQVFIVGTPLSTTLDTSPPTINQSFTVGPGSNALVFEFSERNGNNGATAATLVTNLQYNGIALTNAIELNSTLTTNRDVAIYYLYNPPVGTFSLTGTTQPSNVTTCAYSLQALSGVNTTIAPTTGGGEDTVNYTNTTVTLSNLPANSFAALAGSVGQSLTGTATSFLGATSGNTTGATISSAGDGVTYTQGYVLGNATGGNTFSLTYTQGTGTSNNPGKLPLVVADFAPVPEPSSFGLLIGSGAGILSLLRLRRREP